MLASAITSLCAASITGWWVMHDPEGFRQPQEPTGEVWGMFGLMAYLMVPIVALFAGRRWDWIVRAWCLSLGFLGLLALL